MAALQMPCPDLVRHACGLCKLVHRPAFEAQSSPHASSLSVSSDYAPGPVPGAICIPSAGGSPLTPAFSAAWYLHTTERGSLRKVGFLKPLITQ